MQWVGVGRNDAEIWGQRARLGVRRNFLVFEGMARAELDFWTAFKIIFYIFSIK